LLVSGPFGIDEPAPIPFSFVHSKHSTSPISPNLPTHSESPSPSFPLIPPKQLSVKIEEVEDVEMHSPSPSSPEAGPSQYTLLQVLAVIP